MTRSFNTERPELDACTEVIEQLCACMRALAANGPGHEDVQTSAQACRRAISGAKPPFALRFLSDSVLRDREPIVLSLGAFRRAQILMGWKREVAEAGGDLARLRMRQHGHCGLALGLLGIVLGHQIHRALLRNLPNPSCL